MNDASHSPNSRQVALCRNRSASNVILVTGRNAGAITKKGECHASLTLDPATRAIRHLYCGTNLGMSPTYKGAHCVTGPQSEFRWRWR